MNILRAFENQLTWRLNATSINIYTIFTFIFKTCVYFCALSEIQGDWKIFRLCYLRSLQNRLPILVGALYMHAAHVVFACCFFALGDVVFPPSSLKKGQGNLSYRFPGCLQGHPC